MSNIFQKILKKLGFGKEEKKESNYTKIYDDTIKHTHTQIPEIKNERNNLSENNVKISEHNNTKVSEYNSNLVAQKIQEHQPTLNYNNSIEQNIQISEITKIYDVAKINKNKINTIWDVIKAKENTQAEHIINCLPEDQWIDMEELKQRIKLQYNIEYQNEKSLYPYIKTLTDINLIKLNNAGKKRTWKKNIILIEKE